MDVIVDIATLFMAAMVVIAIIIGPFSIGDEREPFSAANYLAILLECALFTIMAGRIWGWW